MAYRAVKAGTPWRCGASPPPPSPACSFPLASPERSGLRLAMVEERASEAVGAGGGGGDGGGGGGGGGEAQTRVGGAAGGGVLTVRDIDLLITLEGEEAEAKANLERVQRDKADLAKKYQEAKAAAMEAEHYLEIIQKKVKRFRNRLDLCPCWECRVTCCHGPCKQLEAMEAMMGPSQRAKARKLRHQYAENLNTVD